MITTLKYEFCKVEVYSKYIIVVMNEGITLTPEKNDFLLNIATKYFKNSNFGYITNRINSYSVDPSIYIETSKIENLVAFAVVSSIPLNISNAQIEKIFYKNPFCHFLELNEAVSWVKEIVEKSKD